MALLALLALLGQLVVWWSVMDWNSVGEGKLVAGWCCYLDHKTSTKDSFLLFILNPEKNQLHIARPKRPKVTKNKNASFPPNAGTKTQNEKVCVGIEVKWCFLVIQNPNTPITPLWFPYCILSLEQGGGGRPPARSVA